MRGSLPLTPSLAKLDPVVARVIMINHIECITVMCLSMKWIAQ